MSTLYNLEAVQARISNDIEADRLVYAEEIFDWTDAYSETYSSGEGEGQGTEEEQLKLQRLRSIGRLWMRYAGMEQQLKQWKKVVQVFEDALLDPSSLAGGCLEVHLAYAAFCRQRGKVGNAQKVFVRALTAQGPLHTAPLHPVTVRASRLPPAPAISTSSTTTSTSEGGGGGGGLVSVAAADLLWAHFLLMMRASGSGGGDSSDLAVEQLYTMLSSQMVSAGGSSLEKPSSFALVDQLAASSSGAGKAETETVTAPLLAALVEAFVLGRSEEMEAAAEEEVGATTTASTPMEVEQQQEQQQEEQQQQEAGSDGIKEEEESPLKRARMGTPGLDGSAGATTVGAEVAAAPRRREGSRFSNRSTLPEQQEGGEGRRDSAPQSLSVVSLVDFGDLSSLNTAAAKESQPTAALPPLTLTALLAGFRDRPTLLFSAPHKEPLLSGFAHLDAALIDDIEKFFGSDDGGISAGHGSNGSESLAQELCAASAVADSPVARCLGVLEGLWTCQGLQEGYFDKWFNTLLSSHRVEEEALRRQHYEEDSKLRASKGSATSLAILRSKHEQALRALRTHASLQTDLLNANVNRTLCLLRGEQEEVLRHLAFPHSGDVDSEQLYHFYNQQKHGLEKVEMKSVSESAKFEHMHTCLLKQRTILGALLSLCPSLSPNQGGGGGRGAAPLVPPPPVQRSLSSFSVASTGSDTTAATNTPASLSPRSPDHQLSSLGESRGSGSGKKKRRRKLVDVQEQQDTLLRQRSGSSSGYSSGGGGGDMYDPFGAHGTLAGPAGGLPYVAPATDKEKIEKSQLAATINHQKQMRANQMSLDSYGPGAGAGGGHAHLQNTHPPPPQHVPYLPPPPVLHSPSPSQSQHTPSATSSAPPAAAASSAKAINLAKIAALLASKKANKK